MERVAHYLRLVNYYMKVAQDLVYAFTFAFTALVCFGLTILLIMSKTATIEEKIGLALFTAVMAGAAYYLAKDYVPKPRPKRDKQFEKR